VAIAFFAGLMNIIPYIGPLIGMSFGLVIGLSANLTAELSMEPIPLALLIIGVFGVVQLIDNFILQPLIFSSSINAHPLEIFLVISIAAVIAGIPGMIVAVPTYSVLRLLAREFFPNVKAIRKLTQNLQSIDGN
ncbi:MAG: AI-2E family transporter, partial [Owenweeksia sp.]